MLGYGFRPFARQADKIHWLFMGAAPFEIGHYFRPASASRTSCIGLVEIADPGIAFRPIDHLLVGEPA